MRGLMQTWRLTTDTIIDHAARWHGQREVIERAVDGSIVSKTYAEIRQNARRISAALLKAGIGVGDRVATLAMNGTGHLEAWYGITGIGAVCHTLNPRLFEQQLRFIVNHAEDRLILSDGAFAPLLAQVLDGSRTVSQVVFLSAPHGNVALPFRHCGLTEFCAGSDDGADRVAWGGFDEGTAAGLCYTSGTTGEPKGVLYSHRSNVLHAMMAVQPDVFGFSVRDTILPIVPMYHANAWGIAHSAPMVGARLVLPGARLDGASLYELIEQEQVTVAAGVPTVWLALIDHIRMTGGPPQSLRTAIIGGAAAPEGLIRTLHEFGIEPLHAWGMTELSPVGGAGTLTPQVARLPFEEQLPFRVRQGRSAFGVDIRITDEDGHELPHDGTSSGLLGARGFAVASAYFRRDEGIIDDRGYMATGDIATIDNEGFMRITDRAKDIVKSGGEWISSQELEAAALLHPKAAMAAVVGIPHDKWGERPVLYLQLRSGEDATSQEFRVFLAAKVARWWVPEEIIFLDEMPLGATGKIDKMALRKRTAGA